MNSRERLDWFLNLIKVAREDFEARPNDATMASLMQACKDYRTACEGGHIDPPQYFRPSLPARADGGVGLTDVYGMQQRGKR